MPGFVLLVRDRDDADAAMRVGFTVTKKIGNAVVRNRMKRRFRALAREIVPDQGFAGSDHVMIGRAGGIERDFGLLRAELAGALDRLRQMIARLLILIARGWQTGPVAGPSAKLPLPAELLGLCDHRDSALWGRARGLAGAETHLPLPSVGRPGPRPRTVIEDQDASERQQAI